MSALDPKKTYGNLRNKGFTDSETKSPDHKYLEFHYDNKLILYTKLSHSGKYLGNHLIKQMSVQCKLDKNEFMALANCPLSKKEYIQILKGENQLN